MTKQLFRLIFFAFAFLTSAQSSLAMKGNARPGHPLDQISATIGSVTEIAALTAASLYATINQGSGNAIQEQPHADTHPMQEPTLVLDDSWHPAIQEFIDQHFPDRSQMPDSIYELISKLQALDDETLIRKKLNEIVRGWVADNSALVQFDIDAASIILIQLERSDHQSYRLVCYEWRACADWYLKHRANRKKVKPILRHMDDNNFLRMVCLDHAHTAMASGNYIEAFRLFSHVSSYEQGNAYAMYCVGHLFLMGKGVARSIREGLYQLNNAAEAGLPEANYDLGIIFDTGLDADREIAVTSDHKRAFTYFERAHELGHNRATYELGRMYYEGSYVPKNLKKGLLLIKQAADNGYGLAKTVLEQIEK